MNDKVILKPCPFCKKEMDATDPDTLHRSGTIWKTRGESRREYVSFRTQMTFPEKDMNDYMGWCYEINCRTSSGGCGANISGDSQEEVINKWNRRT